MATAEDLFNQDTEACRNKRFVDAAESWNWAADVGHSLSGALLAQMLIDGKPDVPADRARAFRLASSGAAHGCQHSKGVLSCCYSCGYGVASDERKAFELATESATGGSSIGQYQLSRCYARGIGVEPDQWDELRYLRLAAEQGYALAQHILAMIYEWGSNLVQRNTARAVELYRLAAEQGDESAQWHLDYMSTNQSRVSG